MDWTAAFEKYRDALKRVVAELIASARERGQSALFSRKGALPRRAALAEKGGPSPAPILLRYDHCAIMRLLRPAESAARRLVIIAARGLVVAAPRLRPPKPPKKTAFLRKPGGTGIWVPPAARLALARMAEQDAGSAPPSPLWRAEGRAAALAGMTKGRGKSARPLVLPLFDRPRRFGPRRVSPVCVPRILFPGLAEPFPVAVRQFPSPRDLVDATRLHLRLAAVAAALDDLPAHALRFARWQARRDALAARDRDAAAQHAATGGAAMPARNARHPAPPPAPRGRRKPARRVWPLRAGRPPGQHSARSRHPVDEVHDILGEVHYLACEALKSPDTS